MTYTNGDVYVGGWMSDWREGKGQFTSKDGSIKYEGEWKDDVMEGSGVYVKPGFKYEGELRSGRLYGQGTPPHDHTFHIPQIADMMMMGWDGMGWCRQERW
jgi:hypothetical protein